MLHFSKRYIAFILGICALGLLALVPNLLSKETTSNWPQWAQNRIGLGLDLRGGAHILLAMNTDELRRYWLEQIRDEVRARLQEKKIAVASRPAVVGNTVQVRTAKPTDTDDALREIRATAQALPGGSIASGGGPDREATRDDSGLITITIPEPAIQAKTTSAISSAIEVVRRRVDALGNKEANIVRQGSNRILVQVPGLENTTELKTLIGQTAKLTFQMVHPTMTPADVQGGRVPQGYRVIPSVENDRGGPQSYLVEDNVIVSGEDLVDAQPGFDQRTNEPIISFRFNSRGAQRFGRATRDNVGRPFAIVIDNGVINGQRDVKVVSAPVIREPILGGTGQISGSFTIESANQLAIQLRSGALPASLTVVEERVVGASLGQDSIDAGLRAAMVGGVLVAGFMIFAYGLFGVFAVIGATLHVALVLAIMSILQSTMTLPGIAGVVLTIGMAVDANVLIYERIREELRNGKTPISAIEAGFTRAYATIVDSQLTTFIAGLVMFWLGSGPIRGFAVTLTLGILTTVFTAFTVARLLVVWWLELQKGRKVEAPLSFKANRT